MIYPKNNKLVYLFFHYYIRYIIKGNFHDFRYNSTAVYPDKSILLLANHFSWWDGFLLYWLNYKLFKKKFHIMVLEDTVRRHRILKYMGAFSINKKSREMMHSLDYAAKLLHDPQNLVLIFPQGNLHSNFTDDVRFEKGIMKVIKQAAGRFQYVFVATFIENLQFKKPTIYVNVQTAVKEGITIDELKELYGRHYYSSKLLQSQIVIQP